MKLIIVESPAKCATIERYLGSNYMVKASKGHIRDLANTGKGGLGVNVDEGFAPNYVINKDKKLVVNQLIKDAKECEEVILATDPDREGEAIAWHLATVLGLDIKTTKRLEFHEITRDSISTAMADPRLINESLVASQETRRILDRIIGYKLSNLINRKIKAKSAGRVQSATLKLIHEHEKEIENFVSEEYWTISVKVKLGDLEFDVNLVDEKGKSIEIKTKEEADEILNKIPEVLSVVSIDRSVRSKESKEPFTTSTLQQEAFSKLKFKTSKTQKIAQKLYEGFDVGGEHVGLITYMRTDSTRLSPTFISRATEYILNTFGKEYLGNVKSTKGKGNIQDAHEAIRHTSNKRTPESIKPFLSTDEYNLYKLIYNRTIASLLKPKKEEVLTVVLGDNGVFFKFEMSRTIFKGYEIIEDKKSNNDNIVDINLDDKFVVSLKEGEQKFTQPPSHYSEAKIVKLMEELGIGRPSTYVPTIQNLIKSEYIVDEAGIIKITQHGAKTAHVLDKYFPDIVNVKYTAKLEKQLDDIQSGKETRLGLLNKFYNPFITELEKVNQIMYKDKAEETGELCPKCGAPLIYREGRHGQFIGCSAFPTCDYIQKEEKAKPKETGEKCPVCGLPLVERKDKKGRVFIGCSGYPKCTFIKQEVQTFKNDEGEIITKKCPKCGGNLIKKKGKYSAFLGCENYPNCNYMEKIIKPRKNYKKQN